MKKDVIYIDTEDDITAIIDKVKSAEAPIVALVPPKRVGVLQSVVNLKLLKRAAEGGNKRVVLVTSDPALTALAAGLSLPIAKNLQSKPEVMDVPVLRSDDEDIIEGDELPVESVDETSDEVATVENESHLPKAAVAAKPSRKDKKIPNFNAFRKRLVIGGCLGVLLVVFLVWALLFAGHAKVVIAAQTSISNISKTLQLTTGATLDPAQNVIPPVVKQVKKTQSVDFTATGKKDVGEKATGTVKFSIKDIDMLGTSIPAGTSLTTNGLVFTTNSAVTMTLANYKGATVGVTAAGSGTKYNSITGALANTPSGVSAVFTEATSGGTDKTVAIVSQDDVTKATAQLTTQDANTVRDELKKQFTNEEIVIQEGFIVEPGSPVASPAVGQEAASGKVTLETTYSLIGIKRTDLKSVYEAYLKSEIGNDASQKVYASGDETTSFSEFSKTATGFTVKASATAQIGPNIDKTALASDLKGLREGEVQQKIEAIQGVESVDVELAPFWVNRVPNDTKRIEIQFTLKTTDGSQT